MLNKKMMKKNGTKTLSAILIAASMMSAAVPAMAAENHNEFTQIVTEAPADLMQEEADSIGEKEPDEEEALMVIPEDDGAPQDNGGQTREEELPERVGIATSDRNDAKEEKESQNENDEQEEKESQNENDEQEEKESQNENDEQEEKKSQNENDEQEEDGSQNETVPQNIQDNDTQDDKNADEQDPEEKGQGEDNIVAELNEEAMEQNKEAAEQNEKKTPAQTEASKEETEDIDAVDLEVIKLSIKKELQDRADADKAKKAEQEKQKKIDEAGAEAGKLAADIINGKYKSASEAAEAIGRTALKYINKTVIKEIPYIGSFASALIDGMTGEQHEDQTLKTLKTIEAQLNKINDTIEKSADKIIDNDIAIERNRKLETINGLYEGIYQSYRQNMFNYETATGIMAENNDDKSRDKQLKVAEERLDTIYTPVNRKFFDQYIHFCDFISNGGQLVGQRKEISPDVFDAFNTDVVRGKDGPHAAQEFAETKKMLIANVANTCGYGYDVLSTIIDVQTVNQKTLVAGYTVAVNELQAQLTDPLKKISDEERETIEEAIVELKLKMRDCETLIGLLNTDKTLLNLKKNAINQYVMNEITEDEKKAAAFKEYKAGEKFENNCFVYDVEEFNGKKVYPKLNTETKLIEYRDCYGNMVGTRTLENKTKVDQYKVEVGKVYHFETTKMADLANTPFGEMHDLQGKDCVTCDIKVTRVYEKPVYYTTFGINIPTGRTIRTIEGIDMKTKQKVTGSIGSFGVWEVFKRTTDQAITPYKKSGKA